MPTSNGFAGLEDVPPEIQFLFASAQARCSGATVQSEAVNQFKNKIYLLCKPLNLITFKVQVQSDYISGFHCTCIFVSWLVTLLINSKQNFFYLFFCVMTSNSVLFSHQPLKWKTKYLAVDNMTLKKMQIRKKVWPNNANSHTFLEIIILSKRWEIGKKLTTIWFFFGKMPVSGMILKFHTSEVICFTPARKFSEPTLINFRF